MKKDLKVLSIPMYIKMSLANEVRVIQTYAFFEWRIDMTRSLIDDIL